MLYRGVLGEHPAEVAFAEDQHAVGEFVADGQHEAFGEAVRPRPRGESLTTAMPATTNQDAEPAQRDRAVDVGEVDGRHAWRPG